MSREPLKNGTVLSFPDGQEHEILRLLGAGGNALLYETKILGSELYAAVKEVFPACGYTRKEGQIGPQSRLSRKEKELQRRKNALTEQETLLSQKASRKNYHVLFLQPPVWHRAGLRLPDGTVFPEVENTYARMDSLAEKGIPLAQLIQDGPLPLDEALSVMETVLDAYAALHEDGFLHGDCQISNLFLLKAGRAAEGPGTACIIDFGSARELGADGLTAPITDELFSTDGYCAPELMFPRGNALRLSAAADVWSLGFLLLRLLTGRDFEEIDGITEFLMLHPEEKVLTHAEAAGLDCSPAQQHLLNHILTRALPDDPDGRYPDAGAMRADLRRLIRCRSADPSKELNRHLLWEAAWRYQRSNPSLFRTEHVSRLTNGRVPRRLVVEGRRMGQSLPLSATLLLHEQAQMNENTYLFGAGGAGKSFAIAPLIADWIESGERIPLYLDLASFTAEALERCDGDESRVIPTLLAKQYFGRADLAEKLDALLKAGMPYTPVLDGLYKSKKTLLPADLAPVRMLGAPYALVLDNLHKVESAVLPAALTVLNGLQEHWPGVWVLVQGRAEDPGAESCRINTPSALKYEGPRGNLLTELRRMWKSIRDESDEIYDPFEPIGSIGITGLIDKETLKEQKRSFASKQRADCALKLRQVELLPLTTKEMLHQVRLVRSEGVDFAAGATLLKQAQTLQLPLFLMRYLELLASGQEDTAMPNSAMELLHGYFALQEYHGGEQELHELLREQMPWIACQYGRFQRTVNPSGKIAAWLHERCGSDVDVDGFFRRAVDELAVLEYGSWDEYYFVHDCYQEYFSALFAANCIRQSIAWKSAEPLKAAVWMWTDEEVRRTLDLCGLTVREGKVVRTHSETEVLDELCQTLLKQRRRDLIPLNNLLSAVMLHLIVSPRAELTEQDEKMLHNWRKLYQKSLSGLVGLFTFLLTPLFLLLG